MADIVDQNGRSIAAQLQAADTAGPSPVPVQPATGPAPALPSAAPAPTKTSPIEDLVARLEAVEARLARLFGHIFGA